jgi:4-hydroxythreonine-4-phosphate dehydrogenase
MTFSASQLRPLAITMGDPCGIGPEIIVRAWSQDPHALAGAFVVGDVGVLRRAMPLVHHAQPWPVVEIDSAADALSLPPRCLPVLQALSPLPELAWGQLNALAGQAAGDCVMWAARAALRQEIAAMVTAPLHKEALSLAGSPYNRFPGHTELLQAEAAEFLHQTVDQVPVRMMLANEELRTVLVSIHVSLRHAIDAVTAPQIQETLNITHASLSMLLGRAPRIAVAGLNPHAGEGGLFGDEEIRIITPAIEAARRIGIDAIGPIAPDTVFMRARCPKGQTGEFDVVIAMYHDQGLIPVKYMGLDQGVNVTLGLPLVRTSPDHGTAFDIAGQGVANADSLLQAIKMARTLSA